MHIKVLVLKSVAEGKRGDVIEVDHRVAQRYVNFDYVTRDLDAPIGPTAGDMVSSDFEDDRLDDIDTRLAALEGGQDASGKTEAPSSDPGGDKKPGRKNKKSD